MRRYATKADRAAAEAIIKRGVYPEMMVTGVVMNERKNVFKVENSIISSPPETAQEVES